MDENWCDSIGGECYVLVKLNSRIKELEGELISADKVAQLSDLTITNMIVTIETARKWLERIKEISTWSHVTKKDINYQATQALERCSLRSETNEIVNCPTCGTLCRVVGQPDFPGDDEVCTVHYEPVNDNPYHK